MYRTKDTVMDMGWLRIMQSFQGYLVCINRIPNLAVMIFSVCILGYLQIMYPTRHTLVGMGWFSVRDAPKRVSSRVYTLE